MAKVDPLPANPINADLANGIMQLHECLEEHRAVSSANNILINQKLDANVKAVESNVKAVEELKKNQEVLLAAFNIKQISDNTISTNSVATMSPKEAFWKIGVAVGSSLGAVLTIWKVIGVSWPFIWQMLKAINMKVVG